MSFLEPLTQFCQQHEISCRKDTPMRDYTTFRVGGKARFSALPSSVEELKVLLQYLHEHEIAPVWFVGRGSNLLVSDNGLDGVVIFTWGLSGLKTEGNTLIADAGVGMNSLCRAAEAGMLQRTHAFDRRPAGRTDTVFQLTRVLPCHNRHFRTAENGLLRQKQCLLPRQTAGNASVCQSLQKQTDKGGTAAGQRPRRVKLRLCQTLQLAG